jgi:hypothetical protein
MMPLEVIAADVGHGTPIGARAAPASPPMRCENAMGCKPTAQKSGRAYTTPGLRKRWRFSPVDTDMARAGV